MRHSIRSENTSSVFCGGLCEKLKVTLQINETLRFPQNCSSEHLFFPLEKWVFIIWACVW